MTGETVEDRGSLPGRYRAFCHPSVSCASLGTTARVVFLDMRTHFHSEALTATQSSANAASRELLQGVGRILNESGVPVSVHEPGALHYPGQVVYAQASALGFQDGFMVLTAVFVLAMVPAWALGRRRDGG